MKSAMSSLALILVACGIIRADLSQMPQSHDEPIRTFAARVRDKAETCGFIISTKCSHCHAVQTDYTKEMIRDMLLAGICDLDIRRDHGTNW